MSSCGISRMYEGLFSQRAIYLSDSESAHDLNLLKKLNITAVLSVAKQIKIDYPKSIVPEHLQIPAVDNEKYEIQSIFDRTFEFINTMHLQRNVLIHCAFGVSRSAAVFIAYRIRKHGQSYQQALSISKKRRPIINPNKGFVKALERYSQKHHQHSLKHFSIDQRHIDRIRFTRSIQQRKRSLPYNKQLDCQNGEQKQKQSPFFYQTKQHACQNQLNQINIKKQIIQQKLQQIQSYYHNINRGKSKYGLKKINSVQFQKEVEFDNQFLQKKNFSAQI